MDIKEELDIIYAKHGIQQSLEFLVMYSENKEKLVTLLDKAMQIDMNLFIKGIELVTTGFSPTDKAKLLDSLFKYSVWSDNIPASKHIATIHEVIPSNIFCACCNNEEGSVEFINEHLKGLISDKEIEAFGEYIANNTI
jgi:hypothetical protein